ncbi:hypothetical protein HanIR_Chr16g0789621 [Helianthus annuus]|nr:hypothetical protein HanIR_Chr16g0789621 [Helianthus annuus]
MFNSHLVHNKAMVGNDRRSRETWVRSLESKRVLPVISPLCLRGMSYRFFLGIGGGLRLLSEYSVWSNGCTESAWD